MKAAKFDEISQFCFDAKRKLGEFHHIFAALLEKIKFNNNRLSIFLLLFLFLITQKFLGGKDPLSPPLTKVLHIYCRIWHLRSNAASSMKRCNFAIVASRSEIL